VKRAGGKGEKRKGRAGETGTDRKEREAEERKTLPCLAKTPIIQRQAWIAITSSLYYRRSKSCAVLRICKP